MRYFEFELWRRLQNLGRKGGVRRAMDEWTRRDAAYRTRLHAIERRLPRGLLDASSVLHDSQLLKVSVDPGKHRATLMVRSSGEPPIVWRWVYEDVRRIEWINHEHALPGPPGFGDLGYDEMTLHAAGFEHRFITSGGLEAKIVASGFRMIRDRAGGSSRGSRRATRTGRA